MADRPAAIEVQKYLGGVDYPVSKDQLVSTARENGAPDDLVEALENSDQDSFDAPTDVSSALAGE
ncbi:DUF2795 domain-containing protein [Microbacterium sp. NPDC057407]|uniref:DUF2795 domain-containing protein n=1 Tax=Microbacterium sp. NPDC057407 TaxID=3346120 RepID=UPI00366D3E34